MMKKDKEGNESGRSMKTLGLVLVGALVVAGMSFYGGSVLQMNADQAQMFAQTKGYQLSHPNLPASVQGTSNGPSATVTHETTFEFFVEVYYSPQGHGLSVNQTLLDQGFTADCIAWCFGGVHYFKDPTTLITSQGRGVEQCLVFGSSLTDTCTASNFAKYIGWSLDTHTPAAGDTYAGGATIPCSSTNLIIDANGLRDVAGTITAGANGATVTTTIAKTFSITATYTAVQVSCMLSGTGTNADSGTNPLIYAESTFGPDTFANGDSLTGTWTVARS